MAQKQILKNYMKTNFIHMKGNFTKANGVQAKKDLWDALTSQLNAVPNGVIKCAQKWRKVSEGSSL
jgi:hypothetical protein